jgi:hypothetical protein
MDNAWVSKSSNMGAICSSLSLSTFPYRFVDRGCAQSVNISTPNRTPKQRHQVAGDEEQSTISTARPCAMPVIASVASTDAWQLKPQMHDKSLTAVLGSCHGMLKLKKQDRTRTFGNVEILASATVHLLCGVRQLRL